MSLKKKVLAGSEKGEKAETENKTQITDQIGEATREEVLQKENNLLRHELSCYRNQEAIGRRQKDTLISFESGHYKHFNGEWKGDSVWAHFTTEDGRTIHVNKDKVEYIQTKER